MFRKVYLFQRLDRTVLFSTTRIEMEGLESKGYVFCTEAQLKNMNVLNRDQLVLHQTIQAIKETLK